MELKDRIREAMEGAGLKPLQFATKMGKTSGAVTHWLDGRTKSLKAETAAKMETVTGYSATWIVTEKGEKKVARVTAALTAPMPALQASGGPSPIAWGADLAAQLDSLSSVDIKRAAYLECSGIIQRAREAEHQSSAPNQSSRIRA